MSLRVGIVFFASFILFIANLIAYIYFEIEHKTDLSQTNIPGSEIRSNSNFSWNDIALSNKSDPSIDLGTDSAIFLIQKGVNIKTELAANGDISNLININVSSKRVKFKMLEGLLIALVSGIFGASFSMLVRTQNRISSGTLEDLRAGYRWFALIIRAAVGLGAAMILYFFFESELLGGNLWPDLNRLGLSSIKDAENRDVPNTFVPNKEICLLVIWCFIAGFSENFVPNILVKTESKGQVT